MEPDEGEVEDRLGDEVPIADRVERVVEGASEAEVGGSALRIDGKRRSGQRTGAQRGHVEPVDGLEEAVDVAPERPAVGEQVMAEQYWLRSLEVGIAGEVGVARPVGAVGEHLLHAHDLGGDLEKRALAPQAEVGGDLIVAAAGRVQLGTRRPRQLRDATLDCRVDVLIAVDELELLAGEFGLDGIERRKHGVALIGGDKAGASEPANVRP